MRPQNRRQRTTAIAVQLGMMAAGIAIGTYFVVQAVSHAERRDFHIFAALACYGIAVFYGWLQVRRWRREKRIRQVLAEEEKRKPGSSSRS